MISNFAEPSQVKEAYDFTLEFTSNSHLGKIFKNKYVQLVCGGHIFKYIAKVICFTLKNIVNCFFLLDFQILQNYGVLLQTIRKMLVMKSKIIVVF